MATIAELLANGTQLVWVAHLIGPRRVDVHRPDTPMRTVSPGDELTAPGILRNPVPVEALYDRAASHRAILRNLLQREGYDGIQAILEHGLEQGRRRALDNHIAQSIKQGIANSILTLLEGRGLSVDGTVRERVTGCRDAAELEHWLLRTAQVPDARQIFD